MSLFGAFLWKQKSHRTFAPSLKLVAKMLTFGIAQTSLALLSLNRIFALEIKKQVTI